MVDPQVSQKQWLVRKSGATISVLGPYYTDQVRMMVEQGMLDAEDEVCQENNYWFAIREVAEVKKFLGIENVPVHRASDDESTQPDLEAPTDPAIRTDSIETTKRKQPSPPPPMTATELANRFSRVHSTSKFLGYDRFSSSPQVLGIEKSRFWSILFFACVMLAVVGVVWVIKSLRV